MLFAENGRGKTTLCAILRSLQTGRPEYILERKTLNASDPTSVHARISGSNITFGTNGWSDTKPEISVFDSVFVHDNVYSGDYVSHDHKKNLYQVIVGEEGVKIVNEIERLDGTIRETNKKINTKKEAVSKTIITDDVPLEDYLAWQSEPDIENKSQQKNTEIFNRKRALEKTNEIQSNRHFAGK